MSELILHHYTLSPFSEKARAMLGYAGLEWQSVTVPEMPPRPKLAPLAGGYRKIPVAQIGADIFCDTRTLSREIARLANKPELVVENCSQEVQNFVSEVDLSIFLASIVTAGNLTLLRRVLKESSLLGLGRLLVDRVRMGSKSKVKTGSPKTMRRQVAAHLNHMETLLTGDFLFGDTPNAGDFSAYHSLWFRRDLAGRPLASSHPKVDAWMNRMQAFGQGLRKDISADKALDIARQAEPRALPVQVEQAPLLGQSVRVAPCDYGRDPVLGELCYCDANTLVLRRHDPVVGQVHVHFPREGYVLSKAH